jgi:hypothetical protein
MEHRHNSILKVPELLVVFNVWVNETTHLAEKQTPEDDRETQNLLLFFVDEPGVHLKINNDDVVILQANGIFLGYINVIS